ncbi:MAG: MOSC domain-containing protein [Candidatus Acidiferrales bacterium]
MLKVVSLNVGVPRTVVWKGHEVTTGIFKEPVDGPAMLRRLDFDGDRQADLTVHGGPAKAAYAYPSEHYPLWKIDLPGMILPWGMFGENLTTEGLDEKSTFIGDKFKIGKAIVMVTQPRVPCYKLAVKFGRDDILKRMLGTGRSGFYFSVEHQGAIAAGDTIEKIHEDTSRVSVEDINRLYRDGGENANLLRRAARLEALPESWRDYLLEELKSHERESGTKTT